MKNRILSLSLAFVAFQLNAQTNLLTNPGFETPVQPAIGNNFTWSYTMDGWTMTGNIFNVIRTDGTPYGGGPDNAQDGVQYVEVYYAQGTVYQDFTLSSNTTIKYGGYFSSRTGQLWTASIDVFAMPSNTLVSTSSTVDITAADIEVWRKVSGTVALPAGTYRFVANIHDDGNFDAAYVQAEASVCICDGNGQIDNNHDGLPDCKNPPAFADILPAWKCGNNNQKVQVCHKGNTLCIAYSALAAHIAHGDYFGPCGTMTCNTVPQINPQSGSRPTSQAGFSVKTYPNPFDKDLTVAVSIDKQAAIQIELIDLLGRQIYRSNTFYTEGVLSVPIAIKGLPSGTYFLKVSNGQEVIQQKVIKN